MMYRGKIEGSNEWIIGRCFSEAGARLKIGNELIQEGSFSVSVRGQWVEDGFMVPTLFEGDVIESIETGERFLVEWDRFKCGVSPFVNGFNDKYKRVGIFYDKPKLLEMPQ